MKKYFKIIKKIVYTGMICFWAVNSMAQGHGGGPHTVYGKIRYANGTSPVSVTFNAYITSRTSDILTETSFGCQYSNGTWSVQCGNFSSAWSTDEIFHIDFSDGSGGEASAEVMLTNNDSDYMGVSTLTNPADAASLIIPDMSAQRGTSVDLPVQMTGLGPADSVVAYQLVLGFDSAVLQAIEATSAGTMTENWGDPYVGPKTDTVRVGGFTSNQPSKRLIDDSGILVKVSFLIHGIPTSTTSNRTSIYFIQAVIYTLDKTIVISNTKTGSIKVTQNPTQVEKNIILYPDWNQISLPIIPENNNFPDVFNGEPVDYVRAYYNGENFRSWESIRPNFLNDLRRFDGIHGYEVKLNKATAVILQLSGEPVDVNTPIVLYEDWNLVGYLPSFSDSLKQLLQCIDPNYDVLWEYREGIWYSWGRERPEWMNSLQVLSPCLAYWILINDACTLVYPSSPLSKPVINPIDKIVQQDESEKFMPHIPKSCDFWALQPDLLNEGDSIHVYDTDGVLCGKSAVLPEGGFLVHVAGDNPLTKNVDEGAREDEEVHFTVNWISTQIEGASSDSKSPLVMGELAIWQDKESKRIQITYLESSNHQERNNYIPDKVSLLPNYPNPFNARTVISYFITFKSEVSLSIYDTQGREIQTLVDNSQHPQGKHQVIWDGCDKNRVRVASGIYIVMLKTKSNKQTMKMVLIY
jgi:hypothetical protein